MVTKDETRAAVARSVLSDSRVPSDDIDVLLQEADQDGQDAVKTVPLLLVRFESDSEQTERNTDLVGFDLDDDGNQVAQIYERQWEGELIVEVWTAAVSRFDVDELGKTVQSVLYGFDTKASNDPLIDENGDEIDGIWKFSMTSSRRVDDLAQTPTVRRWRNIVEIYGSHQYKAPEKPVIETIDQDPDTSSDNSDES
jgi:hypothetical protein